MFEVIILPFLHAILATKRLFRSGPSSIETSHLSMLESALPPRPASPPVLLRKMDSKAWDITSVSRTAKKEKVY